MFLIFPYSLFQITLRAAHSFGLVPAELSHNDVTSFANERIEAPEEGGDEGEADEQLASVPPFPAFDPSTAPIPEGVLRHGGLFQWQNNLRQTPLRAFLGALGHIAKGTIAFDPAE